MRRFVYVNVIIACFTNPAFSQFEVKGTVYDAAMMNYVEGVRVVSTSGIFAITDTLGHYSIPVRDSDSLYFVYNSKPTVKFPVKDIADPGAFNISIKAQVVSKYKVLKEVVVYSNGYKYDSLENRQTYSGIFNYRKPGLYTSLDPYGYGANFDLDQIINAFRFKRNKRLQAFRNRLLDEEKEKYVDSKFGKTYVRRITGLTGSDLDSFLIWYRPSYDFCAASDELDFIQYVLQASDHFRIMEGLPPRRKNDGSE